MTPFTWVCFGIFIGLFAMEIRDFIGRLRQAPRPEPARVVLDATDAAILAGLGVLILVAVLARRTTRVRRDRPPQTDHRVTGPGGEA